MALPIDEAWITALAGFVSSVGGVILTYPESTEVMGTGVDTRDDG